MSLPVTMGLFNTIRNAWNNRNADQSEIDSSVTYWDTDMVVDDPGISYDSWSDYNAGKISDTSATTNRQYKSCLLYTSPSPRDS